MFLLPRVQMMAKYEYADLTVVGWTGSASSPMVVTPIFRTEGDVFLAFMYQLRSDSVHAESFYCWSDLQNLQRRGSDDLHIDINLKIAAKPNHLLWWDGDGVRYELKEKVLTQLRGIALKEIVKAVQVLGENTEDAYYYCDRATAADEDLIGIANAIKRHADILSIILGRAER